MIMAGEKIDYPCEWTYTIIGLDEESLKVAVSEIITDRKYSISFSKKSKKGKYTSLNIKTMVLDEAERNSIYRSLQAGPKIKIVI